MTSGHATGQFCSLFKACASSLPLNSLGRATNFGSTQKRKEAKEEDN